METSSVRSVVIVDDEKSFTDMIGQLLGDWLNPPVHTFTSPMDALKSLDSLRPGIVVTDYYMPGMDGLDLIRAINAVSPDIPCILITGHPFSLEEYDRDDLRNLKAVLPKPFRWNQLADMIERYWVGGKTPLRRP